MTTHRKITCQQVSTNAGPKEIAGIKKDLEKEGYTVKVTPNKPNTFTVIGEKKVTLSP